MSVFTPVSSTECSQWLSVYALGQLESLEGISSGVENTNYFLTTSLGRYVLTLFERLTRPELPFYLNLMAHLARHGLPVAAPIADRHNEYFNTLNERPAAIVLRLAGQSIMTPGSQHCARIGAMLAGLHLAGESYGRKLDNPRGQLWRRQAGARVLPFLNAIEHTLLEEELAHEAQLDLAGLPVGPIHADLFRDNVLWQDERISGVIDFYFAGIDTWLFDVAVTVNDWCSLPNGHLDTQSTRALLDAYTQMRPWTDAEHTLWPSMLRIAALRFWLSRLEDKHLPRQGEMVLVHDPQRFCDILLARREAILQNAIPPLSVR